MRKEWYRDDLEEHSKRDPLVALRKRLLKLGIAIEALDTIQTEVTEAVEAAFERAKATMNRTRPHWQSTRWHPRPSLKRLAIEQAQMKSIR